MLRSGPRVVSLQRDRVQTEQVEYVIHIPLALLFHGRVPRMALFDKVVRRSRILVSRGWLNNTAQSNENNDNADAASGRLSKPIDVTDWLPCD